VNTAYRQPVATKGAAPAAFPAASAVLVRFVYHREEPERRGRLLRGPEAVSDRTRLCLTQVLQYDGFGNLIAVRGADDTDSEGDLDGLDSWSCMPAERDVDPDRVSQRTRWYDSCPGRWMAADPLGFAADDPNLYRYVSGCAGRVPTPDAEARQP